MIWLTMHGFVIAYISMCIDLTQLGIGGYKPSLLDQIRWITQLNSKCMYRYKLYEKSIRSKAIILKHYLSKTSADICLRD